MCGIFGIIVDPKAKIDKPTVIAILEKLFKLSESRGSEACGLAYADSKAVSIFKKATSASKMLKDKQYQQFLAQLLPAENAVTHMVAIGHSRLVTNGSQCTEDNNQPVNSESFIGIHNGIITNDAELWQENFSTRQKPLLDSKVIFELLEKNYKDTGGVLSSAMQKTCALLKGEVNIACLHNALPVLVLATNTGSIYYLIDKSNGISVFASEYYFLETVLKQFAAHFDGTLSIQHLLPGHAVIIDTQSLAPTLFSLSASTCSDPISPGTYPQRMIYNRVQKESVFFRCTQCILPNTFPFIAFDSEGVCNFCRETPPQRTDKDNQETLEKIIEKHRSTDGSADCIVALSGGRDSCYGLHVIKKELKLNPIAYTYDWAMVTDEARRNSARICGELGIEHIVRSANIRQKRKNINANINAWLHRPELGMIPLFMAGDKQFFHYATQVSKQNNLPLVFFCGGNNLEVTRFKAGFCGVQDKSSNTMVGLDLSGKLKLLAYYAKNYLLNPRYINRSLFDTIFAFYSTYVNRQDFIYLYSYIDWNEDKISKTLADLYGWESAADSKSTWRIGDGTAAFYNYIYYTVAGFSEHDTFRSNQIRAGLISRQEALLLAEEENQPRFEAMQEYARLVGFNLDEALTIINNIPKIGI